MLSGKVRWQQVALFALFALVPAVSVSVLGLSAVSTTEITARREVAAMLAAAADRTARNLERGMQEAEEKLALIDDAAGEQSLEAELRRAVPPFADPFVRRGDRGFEIAKPSPERAEARDASCDAEAAALAAPSASAAARREVRARILVSCVEARTPSNRFLWPLAALDALADGQGDAAALAAWIERHASDLSPVERRATLLDVQSTNAIPEALREKITGALSLPRSRKDDLSSELAGAEAQAAIARTQRGAGVIAFKGPTSAGAVRRTTSGWLIGFVVHQGSLSDAISARLVEVPDDLRAEVSAGPDSAGVSPGNSAVPSAVAEIAPQLRVRLLPRDPGIVARQARRSRFLLGGVGVGSTLFACLLALLLYRRMRDVERSSDLRTDFVATVSHELRTPIASVRMLAELLEEGRVQQDEQAEVFAALALEARRLGETVDRLLGFSRMAAGRYKVERRRGSIAAPIAASIEAFEQRNPDSPRVERELDDDIEGDIDAGQIQLAMDNLLANARKYAPDGAPYTAMLQRRDGGAVISVKDRGPGIARRDQARIFRPFERADDRLSRATEGSGIGLALVAEVAKAHGGRAWVESEPGRGATFCLWIEAAEANG